jgi:hypothetical protein
MRSLIMRATGRTWPASSWATAAVHQRHQHGARLDHSGAGFQGKATNANLFVQSLGLVIGTTIADAFQEGGSYLSDAALQTNASVQLGPTNLISNNSWGYDGITAYDMHAASFDQATRDAQPGVPGEQPLLFVFAAGGRGQRQ